MHFFKFAANRFDFAIFLLAYKFPIGAKCGLLHNHNPKSALVKQHIAGRSVGVSSFHHICFHVNLCMIDSRARRLFLQTDCYDLPNGTAGKRTTRSVTLFWTVGEMAG